MGNQTKHSTARKKASACAPLPIRDGVAPSYLWLHEKRDWPNLFSFLCQRFTHLTPEVLRARLEAGEIVNQQGSPLYIDSPYLQGSCIYYYRDCPQETPIPFVEQILYQDEHLLVVDKPHFLPVTPTGRFVQETLLVRLRKKTGLQHLSPIHRLDRETAGVIVFTHDPSVRGAYQTLFEQRAVYKRYEAIAPCLPQHQFPLHYRSRLVAGEPFICMREEAGVPNSETHIDVLAVDGKLCLYELQPLTGKKHQLRVHLAALGAPIVNDPFYPIALECKGDDFSQPLQLLAREISFVDPFTQKTHCFQSQRHLAWGRGMASTTT